MRALRDPDFIKWFYFGMHIKRWLLLLLVGVAVMGLGFSYLLREVYVSYTFPDFFYYLTLQFLPRYARGASSSRAGGSSSSPSGGSTPPPPGHPAGRDESLVNIIYNYTTSVGDRASWPWGRHRPSTLVRPQGAHRQLDGGGPVADDGGSSAGCARVGVPPATCATASPPGGRGALMTRSSSTAS
jgi:hypothetical protein